MNSDVWAVLLPLALLLLLLASQVPVALSLGGAGAVGIWLQDGFEITTNTLASIPHSTTGVYTLTLIPMFILMGLFVSHAGMLAGIFEVAQRLTRRLPGGLGIATVAACTFFGGISGSSVADAATLGRLSVGEMSRRGYDKSYAAAVVAAAGTVAILIPPSIVLVIYGILTSESVGRLLLAGIVPGLLTAVAYASLIVFFALRHEDRGGRTAQKDAADGPGSLEVLSRAYSTDRRTRVFGLLSGVILFGIIVGGLYTGVFTATEAGAVGALAALVLSVAFLITGKSTRKSADTREAVGGALQEAGSLTAMIFALLVGAAIFSHFLVLAGVPSAVTEWIIGLDIPPALVVILFLVALLPLGMIIDGLSMLLIMTPLAYPVISELGYDGVWFGILMVKLIEIGLLTPPVGLNVYVVSGLFKDLKVENVFRRVGPFVVADLVVCALLFGFPEIVMFLPDLASPKNG